MPLRHDMRRGALMMLGATACFAECGGIVFSARRYGTFSAIGFFISRLGGSQRRG